MQEQTRQKEYAVKVKEYEAHIEQAKVEQKRIDHEERRKTLVVIIVISRKSLNINIECTLVRLKKNIYKYRI